MTKSLLISVLPGPVLEPVLNLVEVPTNFKWSQCVPALLQVDNSKHCGITKNDANGIKISPLESIARYRGLYLFEYLSRTS